MFSEKKYQRYDELTRTFRGQMAAYCWSHSCSSDDAEELMQKLFVYLWETIDTLDTNSTVRQQNRWLQKVMRTVFIRHIRDKRKHHTLPLENIDDIEDDPTIYREQIGEMMAVLDDVEQRLLQGRLDGYRLAEMAQTLGMSPEAARQKMHRIMIKLKRKYNS